MSIDLDLFRAAMGQLASGVTVVTMHVAGEDHGFTATSFTSLSLEPMLVLVCVVKDTRSHMLIEQAGHYAVNILSHAQKDVGLRFADALVEDRFANLELDRSISGAPIFPDSLAWVDCKLRDVLPGGDHSIFVGEVIAGSVSQERTSTITERGSLRERTDNALVYHNRQWGRFVSDD